MMWLKLLLLTIYILLLFVLSRVLETLSWCEIGYGGLWSRQLLDPMALSVAKLKALLEQRGVSYDHIVEKSELTTLVAGSGQVTTAEVELPTSYDAKAQTNFTSGAHFIEQVEDAKDSVWLVQVVQHQDQLRIVGDQRWRKIRGKVSKFGVHTGLLDCSLDPRYCAHKNWRSPFLLLALPSEFQKKASIAMHNYSGPVREAVVMRWLKDRLTKKLEFISDVSRLESRWQRFDKTSLEPEIHAVLFTQSSTPPLFFSALSVRFPGRVKFGVVNINSQDTKPDLWKNVLVKGEIQKLPSYMIYTAEGQYLYGQHIGEYYSFNSMERFLRLLYPCLNDIFIISFVFANTMAIFEPLVSNCRISTRVGKLIWSIIKYNIIVIMLWLPIIGVFQMPYVDQVPLVLLKWLRLFSTSYLGSMLRCDYTFYVDRPIYIYISMGIYLISVTLLCKKYRDVEEDGDSWFSFNNLPPIGFGPNHAIGPSTSGYDFFQSLGARLSNPSYLFHPTVSSDYIQNLPTWRFEPLSISELAAENALGVESAMVAFSNSESLSCSMCNFEKNLSCLNHKPSGNVSCLKCSNLRDSTICANCCQHLSSPLSDPSINQTTPSASDSKPSCSNIQTSDKYDIQSPPNVSPSNCSCPILENQPPQESPKNLACSRCSSSGCSDSKRLLNFPPGFMESHQCVICLEEYLPLAQLCGLPCGHVFHETCIFTWLNRDKHFCPMCRWPSYKASETLQPGNG